MPRAAAKANPDQELPLKDTHRIALWRMMMRITKA
jgi:hypothetical protein